MTRDETGAAHGRPRPEVLAPAGDLDSAFAAFEHGADAVYVGLQRFSARAEAANLSAGEVGELTAYAHGQPAPRRVYATVNTLVQQAELPDLVDGLASLAETGVDAVIVQDLGVARVARSLFPSLRLHASTQMAVHHAAGARALRELGFSRVVLARELSLAEIRDVVAGGGIEVEVFVHGALCYCTSGLCLYSSHLRGRSGNRGRCAYPCRERFRSEDGWEGHPFSMKDMSRADRVGDLAEAGVASLKIEGRMKGPLYVACLSRLYRGAVDGTLRRAARDAIAEDARTIFSRLQTDLYLDGHAHRGAVDAQNVGHRGARIGEVAAVTARAAARGKGGGPPAARRLRFKTSRALERHDGLQVDLPGQSAPYGFAVEELWVAAGAGAGSARSAYVAEPGATVEVALPDDAPAIPVAAPVYCASSQAVKRTYTFTRPRPGTWAFRRLLQVVLNVRPDGLRWTASVQLSLPGAAAATAAGGSAGRFEPARDTAAVEGAARQAFAKLGQTRLSLASLRVDNPDGLFVPVSALNATRRAVADAVEAAVERERSAWLARARERVEQDAPGARSVEKTQGCERWSIRTDQPGTLAAAGGADWAGVDEWVVELNADTRGSLAAWVEDAAGPRGSLRIALPAVTRRDEESWMTETVHRWAAAGWTRWDIGGLAGLTWLREAGATARPGFDLTADWTLYVLNAPAAAALVDLGADRVTLSPEDDLANWRRLPASVVDRAVVPVYQDTPLFVSETCARPKACAQCRPDTCVRREDALVSGAGDRVIAVTDRCRTTVIHERPFCLARALGELRAVGFGRFRIDLAHRAYTPEQARDVWRAVRAGRDPVPCHTGNVLRGIDAGARTSD